MTYMITNIIGIVNQQIPDQTPSKAGRPSSLNPVMINLPWRIEGMLMPAIRAIQYHFKKSPVVR